MFMAGLETDPDQPPGIVSPPEPTSQEIRRSDMDNQWKPLPHGPLIRTTESTPKTETPDKKPDVPFQTYGAPQTQTEQVSNLYVWAGDTKRKPLLNQSLHSVCINLKSKDNTCYKAYFLKS
ncbi:uncharacterized protein CEXT_203411 [Caerostris extrusa]|uniref:Prolactin receptor n=1 Tax=Caerostris extrusa TaxID=172846 RepID=A0AAV4R726_CAEEX|nr:uncharacterized protein CEXT_203411 [Caerostris extrusa]